MAARRVVLCALMMGLLAAGQATGGPSSSSSSASWKWTTWTPEYGVAPLRWGTGTRPDAPAFVLRDDPLPVSPAPAAPVTVISAQPVVVNNVSWTAAPALPAPTLTIAPVAVQPAPSHTAALPQASSWTIRPEAAATLTSPFAYDAYINMGTGPYAQEYPLTNGGAQPWYASPAVEHVYGGMPTPEQQQQFTRDVLQKVQADYQRSGLNISVTNQAGASAAHTLSVVSGTQSPANPSAVGITDIGRNGFTFIDKLSYANTPDELANAVANNVAHELMHAFGIDRHDPSGSYLDSAIADWSTMINPNSSFSAQAASSLASRDFKQVAPSFGLGAQNVETTTVVPEPASCLAWGLGLAAAAVWARKRRRAARRSC